MPHFYQWSGYIGFTFLEGVTEGFLDHVNVSLHVLCFKKLHMEFPLLEISQIRNRILYTYKRLVHSLTALADMLGPVVAK